MKVCSCQDELCFCHNVTGLFEAIGIECNPSDWSHFIDSSTRSLKTVLLQKRNIYPHLPLAYSVLLTEEYGSIRIFLDALKYEEYDWEVIGNFEIVAFLMVLQGGFTKFPYDLCLWSRRDTVTHCSTCGTGLLKDTVLSSGFIITQILLYIPNIYSLFEYFYHLNSFLLSLFL